MTHVLTDNGSCFTQAFAKVCAELGLAPGQVVTGTNERSGLDVTARENVW